MIIVKLYVHVCGTNILAITKVEIRTEFEL